MAISNKVRKAHSGPPTFPLLVNFWICAVATPGMIRQTVIIAKLGSISYHMFVVECGLFINVNGQLRVSCKLFLDYFGQNVLCLHGHQ